MSPSTPLTVVGTSNGTMVAAVTVIGTRASTRCRCRSTREPSGRSGRCRAPRYTLGPVSCYGILAGESGRHPAVDRLCQARGHRDARCRLDHGVAAHLGRDVVHRHVLDEDGAGQGEVGSRPRAAGDRRGDGVPERRSGPKDRGIGLRGHELRLQDIVLPGGAPPTPLARNESRSRSASP